MTKITRILIADHHGIFVDEIKEVIEMAANLTVADQAADADEVLEKVRDNEYDLLLLDMSLPHRNALKIMSEIKRLRPQLPVLILSLSADEQYAAHALKSGASGYLTKGCSTNELREALQTVAQGEIYLSAAMAASQAGPGATPRARGTGSLSEREYQVMRMVAQGKSSQSVAEELGVGIKIVDSYCLLILQKMKLGSVEELISLARDAGGAGPLSDRR